MSLKYICSCKKENSIENQNYSYWESKDQTSDERELVDHLYSKDIKKKNILHIGIGNSKLALKFSDFNSVHGITISKKEISHAKKLNLNNYSLYLIDKYSVNFRDFLSNIDFDYIIDTNLKSYTCCQKSFEYMMENLFKSLKSGGFLITSKIGMNWSTTLKPKLTFNLKNFFHFKLKEIKSENKNELSLDELEKICKKNNIRLLIYDNLCYLEKC